jgi:hypothetical protein
MCATNQRMSCLHADSSISYKYTFSGKKTNFYGKGIKMMHCCIGKRADCNNKIKRSQFPVAMKGRCYKSNSKCRNVQTNLCLLSINSVIKVIISPSILLLSVLCWSKFVDPWAEISWVFSKCDIKMLQQWFD